MEQSQILYGVDWVWRDWKAFPQPRMLPDPVITIHFCDMLTS
jgi:hypothetical protein